MLKIIAIDNDHQSIPCLNKTLDKWLKSGAVDATWRKLEVALNNVNRAKAPVDDMYGKIEIMCNTYYTGVNTF